LLHKRFLPSPSISTHVTRLIAPGTAFPLRRAQTLPKKVFGNAHGTFHGLFVLARGERRWILKLLTCGAVCTRKMWKFTNLLNGSEDYL
jgi:hypothetical protein